MNTKQKIIISSVGALLITMTGIGLTTAYAQTSDSNTLVTRVAQLLGVDSTKLEDSIKQAKKEQVDQALKDGKITSDQAENMKERIEESDGLGGMGKMGGRMQGRFGMMEIKEELATFLGMTDDQLREAHQNGKTLLEIAKEKGKTEDQLKNFLSSIFDTKLAEQLKEGKITENQANEIKQKKDEIISNIISGKGPRGGMGMGKNLD